MFNRVNASGYDVSDIRKRLRIAKLGYYLECLGIILGLMIMMLGIGLALSILIKIVGGL